MKKGFTFLFLALFLISMTGFILADNSGLGTNSENDEERAFAMALEECSSAGEVSAGGSYNENSKTWWFDLEPFENKHGCAVACVVKLETEEAEVYWMCTGLIIPDEVKDYWKNNSGENSQLQNQIKVLTQSQIQEIKQVRNRIRALNGTCPSNCTCSGSTTKCELNGQRTMTINAGNSGNMVVQVKGVNASTNVTLYKSKGKLYGEFNGETKRIMTPEQVQEKIREKKQKRWEEHNITLDEDGIYRVQSKKRARLFLLIPVREKVRTQIDAETGEVLRVRNSWWGFLANDVKEEPLLGASCGTVSPDSVNECCVNKGWDVWNAEAEECVFTE